MVTDLAQLLLGTFFYLGILIVFSRLLFPLIGVDYNNPIAQFVTKVSDPILSPIRQIIRPLGNFDTASLLIIILLKIIELCLLSYLQYGSIFSVFEIIKGTTFGLSSMLLNFYFYAIFAQIILSWLSPHNVNPAAHLLIQITEPLMRPARKLLPPMGALDLSPIIVLLAIKVIEIVAFHPEGLLSTFFNFFLLSYI